MTRDVASRRRLLGRLTFHPGCQGKRSRALVRANSYWGEIGPTKCGFEGLTATPAAPLGAALARQ